MNFEFTEEQINLKNEVIAFAKRELNDYEDIGFSREKWEKCVEFGLIGMNIGIQYGGMELDYLSSALLLESLGYGCEDNGFVFAITNHLWVCQNVLNRYGSKKLKEKYLPSLVKGKYIGCFAITEADSGSDTFSMNTYAVKENNYYLLNGSKMFISNAPIADVFIVVAKTTDGPGVKEFTAFIVEKDFEGVTVGKTIEKMGLTSCPMAEITLNNCKVPAENIVYEVNKGTKVANYSLQMERIFEFASHIGAMERIMENCIQYVNDRKQFGKPIKEYQSLANMIAEMKVKIELGRTYLYKVAWMVDQGKNVFLEASILKLFVSESYVKTCLDAVQIHGAYGYSKEYNMERELRDSVGATIYSGTSEIQKNIIFKMVDIL